MSLLSRLTAWPALARGTALVAASLALAGCGPIASSDSGGKVTVLATTTHLQDFARNVGGDRIDVIPILAPNTDAHDYQPTAEDARGFSRADLVLYNGVGLESEWFPALAKNVRRNIPVVNVTEASKIAVEKGDDEDPEGDPHVWQDPTNVQKMVNSIRDALAKADPGGAATYQANAAAYNQQLDQLDRDIKQQIESLPPSRRKLVTNHDAFGYYLRRYGITFVGSVIPRLTSDAEPSAGDIRKLIQAIQEQQVKAIYTESNLNLKLEQQIAQQAGVKIYSSLYGDSLGEPGSDGDTYIKSMQHNTKVIVEGLR